jgi:hypothetical protein
MGPRPWAHGQRARANPSSHPGSVRRPRIDDVEPRIDPTGGCVPPPCRGRGGFQPSLDRTDARLDHRSVPGACRGLVADEMDHWSGDCRQGRAPTGARVAALGLSRHRFRREGCFVLDVRPMRLRRAPGTRERRRVAPLSCTAAELDSALRRGGGGGLRSGHTPAQRRQPAEPPRVCRSRGWRPAAAGGGGSAFGARRGDRRRVRDREALLELHGYAGKEPSLCS